MLALIKTEPAGGTVLAVHTSLPPVAEGLHTKPASTAQLPEHPSSLSMLPSSHASPPDRRPSPHVAAAAGAAMLGAGVVTRAWGEAVVGVWKGAEVAT